MIARRVAWFSSAALAACVSQGFAHPLPPLDAFERFASRVAPDRAYAARVALHEELGERSEDSTYAYARDATGRASMRVLEGRGAGLTVTTDGRGFAVYDSSVPLLRKHFASDDARVRSLRGRGIADVDLANFLACVRAHRANLVERAGPAIDGQSTEALVFERSGFTCPGDSLADRALAYDVIDVISASGIPLMRKRYAGREVVERERYGDFR